MLLAIISLTCSPADSHHDAEGATGGTEEGKAGTHLAPAVSCQREGCGDGRVSLLQGANGKTRGSRHMLEYGKSQLGIKTLHLFMLTGRWSNTGAGPGVAVQPPALEILQTQQDRPRVT